MYIVYSLGYFQIYLNVTLIYYKHRLNLLNFKAFKVNVGHVKNDFFLA